MLNRTRKAFTLLELMIAFVIMAILSAVAIPSLLAVATSDRTTADQTTAVAASDAAYFDGVAAAAGAVVPVTYPVAGGSGSEAYTAAPGAGASTWLYTFSDGAVCVSAPNTGGDSPAITTGC